MESNRIQLEFSKTLTNLAGNRFGRTTFGTQVKDRGCCDVFHPGVLQCIE